MNPFDSDTILPEEKPDYLVENNEPSILGSNSDQNPMEHLKLQEKVFEKTCAALEDTPKILPALCKPPEAYRPSPNGPVKNIIKSSQKCLTNLAVEMSSTLQESMACLDDIFFKARSCLNDMQDNDRKYLIAKCQKVSSQYTESTPSISTASTQLAAVRPVSATIETTRNSDSLTEILSAPIKTKIPVEDLMQVKQEYDALEHLERVCKNIVFDLKTTKNNLKEEKETVGDVLSKEQKYSCGDKKKSSTRKEESVKRTKSKTKQSKSKKRDLVRIQSSKRKLPSQESSDRAEAESLLVKLPPKKQQLVERKLMFHTELKPKPRYGDSLWFNPTRKVGEAVPANYVETKKDIKSQTSFLSRTPSCKQCRSSNCKCGIQVKSLEIDVPSRAKMTYIKKTSDMLNNSTKMHPGFVDLLDDIKLSDVERFQSEYPRKDHVLPIPRKCVQDTLLYKLVYDKSLGIWDFLLRNRLAFQLGSKSKTPTDRMAGRENSSNIINCDIGENTAILKKKHMDLAAKLLKQMEEDVFAHKNKSDELSTLKKPKLKPLKSGSCPKDIGAAKTVKKYSGKQSKRKPITALPIQVKYDKNVQKTYYQDYVRKKLRPYIFDWGENNFNVYTVMPVSVFYDNIRQKNKVQETLYPYLCEPDGIQSGFQRNKTVTVLPLTAKYYQNLHNVTAKIDNKWENKSLAPQQPSINVGKMVKPSEQDILTKPMSQKQKWLWNNKYKHSIGHNIVNYVSKLDGGQARNSQQNVPPQQPTLQPPKNSGPPVLRRSSTFPQRTLSPTARNKKEVPVIEVTQMELISPKTKLHKGDGQTVVTRDKEATPKIKDIQHAVSKIENKILDILSNAEKPKPEAFITVEKEITDILASIQNSKSQQLDIKKPSMPDIGEQSDEGGPLSAVSKEETNISNGKNSSNAIAAEKLSKHDDKLDGISKTTLEEVESKIMESFEDLELVKETQEDQDKKAETIMKKMSDVVKHVEQASRDILILSASKLSCAESRSRTDTLELEEKFQREQQAKPLEKPTLIAIKEENQHFANIVKQLQELEEANNQEKPKMHIIDEDYSSRQKSPRVNIMEKIENLAENTPLPVNTVSEQNLLPTSDHQDTFTESAVIGESSGEHVENLDDIEEPIEVKNVDTLLEKNVEEVKSEKSEDESSLYKLLKKVKNMPLLDPMKMCAPEKKEPISDNKPVTLDVDKKTERRRKARRMNPDVVKDTNIDLKCVEHKGKIDKSLEQSEATLPKHQIGSSSSGQIPQEHQLIQKKVSQKHEKPILQRSKTADEIYKSPFVSFLHEKVNEWVPESKPEELSECKIGLINTVQDVIEAANEVGSYFATSREIVKETNAPVQKKQIEKTPTVEEKKVRGTICTQTDKTKPKIKIEKEIGVGTSSEKATLCGDNNVRKTSPAMKVDDEKDIAKDKQQKIIIEKGTSICQTDISISIPGPKLNQDRKCQNIEVHGSGSPVRNRLVRSKMLKPADSTASTSSNNQETRKEKPKHKDHSRRGGKNRRQTLKETIDHDSPTSCKKERKPDKIKGRNEGLTNTAEPKGPRSGNQTEDKIQCKSSLSEIQEVDEKSSCQNSSKVKAANKESAKKKDDEGVKKDKDDGDEEKPENKITGLKMDEEDNSSTISTEVFLTPFMQALKDFRKQENPRTDDDILRFLDTLKYMSGDQLAVEIYIPKVVSRATVMCVPVVKHVRCEIFEIKHNLYLSGVVRELTVKTYGRENILLPGVPTEDMTNESKEAERRFTLENTTTPESQINTGAHEIYETTIKPQKEPPGYLKYVPPTGGKPKPIGKSPFAFIDEVLKNETFHYNQSKLLEENLKVTSMSAAAEAHARSAEVLNMINMIEKKLLHDNKGCSNKNDDTSKKNGMGHGDGSAVNVSEGAPLCIDVFLAPSSDLQSLGSSSTESKKLQDATAQTDISSETLDDDQWEKLDLLKSTSQLCTMGEFSAHLFPAIKEKLLVADSLYEFMDVLPEVIHKLKEHANSKILISKSIQTCSEHSNLEPTIVVKVDSLDKLEKLIDASLLAARSDGKMQVPNILPVMYGVLFSVMYLGLNFTFYCG